MIVLAHAADWLEAALFAVPAGVVLASIVRSVRARRAPVPQAREESTR
jgi:hypothetical protein